MYNEYFPNHSNENIIIHKLLISAIFNAYKDYNLVLKMLISYMKNINKQDLFLVMYSQNIKNKAITYINNNISSRY
jgi:hypothetical protein